MISVYEQVGIRPVFIDLYLGSSVNVSERVDIRLVFIMSEQVGIRPMFIRVSRMCGLSERVGIRLVWNDMFLGSAVSVSERVGIRRVWNDMFL